MNPQLLEILKVLLQQASAGGGAGQTPGQANFPQINGQLTPGAQVQPPRGMPPLLQPMIGTRG